MEFKPAQRRRKPPESFFVFSMNARELRSLAGIQRRDAEKGTARAADIGIQRAHDPTRSSEIARFVRHGYPWSTLREVERRSGEFDDLRKPGWLPTAIVVNILTSRDKRPNGSVHADDYIDVDLENGHAEVVLPAGFAAGWAPKGLHPIEVVDGQHRLWAFDESSPQPYDLPVVAFVGLDISWQAYLFWTINIKPTRINPSLAFDLYPLLRAEDWLERVEGPKVYREARAQELTEVLWSHPESPWHRRINMLGQTRGLGVTQAGFVRSLTNTFIRRPTRRRGAIGGLFTSPVTNDAEPLPWNRTQQAAFLVFIWQAIEDAVAESKADWALFLRKETEGDETDGALDPAFAGKNTYLNTEQGVRAYLTVVNDLCFSLAPDLDLDEWEAISADGALDRDAVELELEGLLDERVAAVVEDLAGVLANFDWRGADAPGLSSDQRALKRAFRGSGGYVEFRRQLLREIGREGPEELRLASNELYRKIKDRK